MPLTHAIRIAYVLSFLFSSCLLMYPSVNSLSISLPFSLFFAPSFASSLECGSWSPLMSPRRRVVQVSQPMRPRYAVTAQAPHLGRGSQ